MASVFSTIKQLTRAIVHRDFDKNPKAPPISEEDKKALFVGLINSEQVTAYSDSLTTGLSRGRILEGLAEAWDINNQEDAYSVIDWLQKGGHRVYYSEIYPLLKMPPEEGNKQIEAIFGEAAPKALQFANNLTECIAARGNNEFAAFNDENMKKGILAWDLGRLVVIARMCFDIGYIDEETAWNIIRGVYEAATKEYQNWKELAISYLIGRGMYGGDSMMLSGLYYTAKTAFENDNSPWKNIPFK
jgi:hypothetical protein